MAQPILAPRRADAATVRPAASQPPAQFSWDDPAQRNPLVLLIVLTLALVVAYWNMFVLTSARWVDDLYSHGYLIPIFALGLFYLRFQPFRPVADKERWIGLGILVAGLLTRLVAAYYDMAPLDRLTFPLALFGVFLMVGGWHTIRWAWAGIVFTLFMFPLPSILEHTLLRNLQRVATISSTLVLQTLGVSAHRNGNIIRIDEIELGVVDACSGLRMLTIFCALAVATVFIVNRPWWDKFIILLSAIPIALLSNIIRIVMTALLYMVSSDESFHELVHDVSGLLMMFWGMGFLWLELQILSRLTVPEDVAQIRPVGGPSRSAVAPVR
jgi:exosortase